MNPPPLGNSNNNISRSGTPNMKPGVMQNARAQQNHTPNQQLMHGSIGSGNSDQMANSMSNQGMYGGGGGGGMPPHSLPSAFPSSYSNYDVGTGGQMSYGVTSMNNSIHSSQTMSHSQPILQR